MAKKTKSLPEFEPLEAAVKKLRTLNHPLRQKLIATLREKKESTVTDLYKSLRLEQSVASQHLSILRSSGLVKTEPRGKQRVYSVNEENVSKLIDNAGKI